MAKDANGIVELVPRSPTLAAKKGGPSFRLYGGANWIGEEPINVLRPWHLDQNVIAALYICFSAIANVAISLHFPQ